MTELPGSRSHELPPGGPSLAVPLASAVAAAVLLHLWLILLWPERGVVGWAMPFFSTETGERLPPLLGRSLYFSLALVLALGFYLRGREAFPRALVRFFVIGRSPTDAARALAGLWLAYGCLILVAALIEALLIHHFATTIAHYTAIAGVAAGLYFAGRRQPFRSVGAELEGTGETHSCRQRRKRLRADAVALLLLVANYGVWMSYERLRPVLYAFEPWQTGLLLVANLAAGALFAACLVHGSLVAAAHRWLVAAEQRAPRQIQKPRGWHRALAEAGSQVGVVALWLLILRAFWGWSHQLWIRGAWLVPFEQPQHLLGVDWYWASVWRSVTAAEVLLLTAAFLAVLESVSLVLRDP
ncbi:MAG: hypothetical protein MI919_43340 [Holophagales bacterium]|nr:hypothetical protein [Holophagales bacterium]